MAYTFHGGTHPDDKKAATNKKAIEPMKAPEQVVLPVSMHIGAPAKPVVQKGDHVYMGQLIAEASGNVSANVHATVSGTVAAVEPRPHPNGTQVLAVVIDNDFKDEPDPSLHPLSMEAMTPEQMTEVVKEAGIVGHGGATFPTHVKIQSAIGKVDTLIINGAECEPYITSDHRILLEQTQDVIDGIKILIKILGVQNGKLAIEENKADVFPVVEKLLPQDGSIQLCRLKTKYPQGAEKQLIYAITHREVPSGKLPADAGCAVFNVDTAAAIARKFKTGMNRHPPHRHRVGQRHRLPQKLGSAGGHPHRPGDRGRRRFPGRPQQDLDGRPHDGRCPVRSHRPHLQGDQRHPGLLRRRGQGGQSALLHPLRPVRRRLPHAADAHLPVPVPAEGQFGGM